MSVAVITGANGLVGSESARYFARLGLDIIGIDNDMRASFFGVDASTAWQRRLLEQELRKSYQHHDCDIRDSNAINRIFASMGSEISLVIHAAAQPSHD
jgi:CDP-paratose 2-epimerase